MRRVSILSFAPLIAAIQALAGCALTSFPSQEDGGAGSVGQGGSAGQGGALGSGGSANDISTLDKGPAEAGHAIKKPGDVIVGMTGEFNITDFFKSLTITKRVNGVTVETEVVPAPIKFIKEIPFTGYGDGDEVEEELYITTQSAEEGQPPYLRHVARTEVVGGKVNLLRAPLSNHCPNKYEECEPFETCSYGVCRDAYVPPSALEEYTPDWYKYSTCKPKNAGPPELLVSLGHTTFEPTNDGDVVQLVQGNQGLKHLWVAVRTRNIERDAFLVIQGFLTGESTQWGPSYRSPLFTDQPALMQCEATEITFLVYPNIEPIILGKEATIVVQIDEGNGVVAEVQKTVFISDVVLE